MKIGKWFSGIATVGVLLAFNLDCLAQKIPADEKEYVALTRKAEQAIASSPRRLESVLETYEDGLVIKSEYTLLEHISADHTRTIRRVSEGGKTGEIETILIGYFEYTRSGNREWSKVDIRDARKFESRGSLQGSGGSCSQKQLTVERVFLGSWPTRLFETIEVEKEKNSLLLTERRGWFGDDGSLLQVEIVEGSLLPRNITSKFLRKIDLQADLKIEAPIP